MELTLQFHFQRKWARITRTPKISLDPFYIAGVAARSADGVVAHKPCFCMAV
jgi:hypothetical protein